MIYIQLYNMEKKLSTIGKNIKKYRFEKKISQDRLSKLADVSCLTVNKIESGATKSPGVEIAQKIARALGVGIDDLMK